MTFLLDIPLINVLIGTVLPFLIVLAIVIFVHEYGHYIVGRWCGIHSDEFSLGFGPEIYGWTDRRGTRWRISWIPLGGYVRFKGDADPASLPDGEAVAEMSAAEKRSTLTGAPLWARAATVMAGPGANFIMTIVVFAGLGLYLGKASDAPVIGELDQTGQAAVAGLAPGDQVLSVGGEQVDSFSGFLNAMLAQESVPQKVEIERDGAAQTLEFAFTRTAQIGGLAPGGAAAQACLKRDDVILAIDDEPITSFTDLQQTILASEGEQLKFTVQRGPELMDFQVAPKREEYIDVATGAVEQRVMIGVQSKDTLGISPQREPMGPLEAVGHGAGELTRVISSTLNYLGAWISGQADGSALGGPIGIARASGETAQAGLVIFIAFIGTVSAAIGFINLFPIPMLDGGHLVFYALEAIRGRPLGDRWVEAGFKVGLAAILLLLLFATYNDIAPSIMGATAGC